MRLLELGGGTRPHPLAFASLDVAHPVSADPIDIGAEAWPLSDGSVDAIYASHVLEHVPKGARLLHVMAEAHRVLRPEGTFTAKLPIVGWTEGRGHLTADWRVHADPTHVAAWWLPEGLRYFCAPGGDRHPLGCHRFPPLFEPLGPRVTEDEAYKLIDAVGTPDHPWSSWWAVGGGWEGLWSLKRP